MIEAVIFVLSFVLGWLWCAIWYEYYLPPRRTEMSNQLYRKVPANHAPRSVGPRQLQEMMAWKYVPVDDPK